MVIKYWAKVYGFNESTQGFTTYSIVILCIFYLQQLNPPILPSVVALQRLEDHKELSSGWMINFCSFEWEIECFKVKNESTLKELLAGFFQFYRDFDYKHVICPFVGRAVPAEQFTSADDIPEEMLLYKEKLLNEPDSKTLKFKTNVPIKTQDPLELNWNITKNVKENMFFLFKGACNESCKQMAEKDDSSLLSSLFSVDKKSLALSAQPYIKVSFDLLNSFIASSSIGLDEQYKLMTEAVLLVMRHVMKAEIELFQPKKLSKVKTVESSQDVHNMSITQTENEGLVYVCHGQGNVIERRPKMKELIKKHDLSLSEYEQEVYISNTLLRDGFNRRFSFQLKISSLNRSKHLNYLEIIMSVNVATNCSTKYSTEVIHFISHNLEQFVKYALNFVVDTKSYSPGSCSKQSLRELCNSRMEKLSSLYDSFRLKYLCDKIPSTLLLQGTKSSLVGKETITSDTSESNHLSADSNLESQAASPKQSDCLVTLSSVKHVKDDSIHNVSDLLTTVLNSEAQSSNTIEKNSHLASMGNIRHNEPALDLSKSKENLSCLDEQGQTHSGNVKSTNIESNTKKMDLNYDAVQTKSEEKLCRTPQNNSGSYKDRLHAFNTRPSVSSETKKPSHSSSMDRAN